MILREKRQCHMKVRKMNKLHTSYVKNERGNTMMISLMVVVCFTFLAFVFFDIFTTYAYKNAGQKAADAAALAAAQEAKQVSEEELELFLEELMEELASLEESVALPFLNFILPASIVEQLMNATSNQLLEIIPDEILTGVMCGAIRENADEITAKAEYFAKENGARELDDIIFPYENHFEIYVSVETETSFITVPDEAFPSGVRDLGTEASASIPLPNGVEFVPSSCH